MLMLVLGDNMLLTFLGWEGVGACSYLLISFWFTSEANASAGKKAFVTNRIGDFGFMMGIFLTFATLGTIQYLDVFGKADDGLLSPTTASAIAALFFLGAIGKSAQFPLYLWLPDAMAGPTPVSALIHAATMVTSGVYLLTRLNPILFAADSWVPNLIAWIGAGTALFAATIAIGQNDIKKVLAYSTISQLGYMFLAVGSGAYVAAIFHMVTHAFFKALLFLGSGSVIHGMHGDQDMRHYGNLRKWMPVTAATFIVGWLAIAGVPPFAGFWSKDEILAHAWDHNKGLWVVGIVTALLTAFYMSRQVFMTFFGRFRANDPEFRAEGTAEVHPHESGWLMLVPLVALAGLSIVGGVINLPFTDSVKRLETWLEPSLFEHEAHLGVGGGGLWLLAAISVAVGLIGIAAAVMVYLKGRVRPEQVELPVFAAGWGIDNAVSAFMGGPGRAAFETTAAFDREVVDGLVDEVGVGVRSTGTLIRRVQNGFVRSYALLIGVGAAGVIAFVLARATL
jgi:NADH-quinone oxidoreductase subunit L